MPRRHHPPVPVILSCLLMAMGTAACGSAEVAGDVVPKTTPELTPPPIELGPAPASADDTGATGATGSTGATGAGDASDGAADSSSGAAAPSGDGTAAPVTPAPAPSQAPATPPTPAPAAPTPPTGGADDGSETQPDADPGGGAGANPGGASPGGLSEFCKQSPGACGQ